VGAIALLILDGAGWHGSPRLHLPDNIVLLPLPPYSPELNLGGLGHVREPVAHPDLPGLIRSR
jgi:hypothetical protein